MGGVVAFEMAVQLQKQGHEIGLLALLDSWAPEPMPDKFDQAALLNQFCKDLGGTFGKDFPVLDDTTGAIARDEQLNSLLERAKMAGLFPADIGLTQFRPLLEVFQANYQALARYIPPVYPHRMALLQANELLAEHSPAPARLGWDKFTSEPIEHCTVSGNHYTILTKPGVESLAEQLRRCLDNAPDTSGIRREA